MPYRAVVTHDCAARPRFFAIFWLVRTRPGSCLEHACTADVILGEETMYIGLGTIVLIVIIVLVVWMLRR